MANLGAWGASTKKYDLKYNFTSEKPYKCVINSLEAGGFKLTSGNDWYALWGIGDEKEIDIKKMNMY